MAQTGLKTQTEAPGTAPLPAVSEETIALGDLGYAAVGKLRVLWEHRRGLGKAVLVGFALGMLIAFLLPVRYQSSAQLMPPDSQSNSGLAMLAMMNAKTGGGLGAVAGDLLGLKSSGAVFVGILNSRTVEERIVERFQLRRVYSVALAEDARKNLLENTGISEDRKSGIISITVTDRNPKRAAAIAQAYVQELNQLAAELSTGAAHRERVFLEGRLQSVKHDLDQASQEFSQFASKNKTMDLKEEARAMLQGAAAVEGELIAAESQLKGLQAIYTDDNPRVRSVQARVTELQRQLDRLGGDGKTDATQPAVSTAELHPTITNLPLLGVPYANLYRRVQIQEVVYQTLTQQYELAKVQEAKETPSVKVLDAANVPESKSFPPRMLISVLGGFFMFGVAAAVVFARERWNNADANDPNRLFAQEVLGTVSAYMPWAAPNGSRLQAMSHKVWIRMVRQREPTEASDSDVESR